MRRHVTAALVVVGALSLSGCAEYGYASLGSPPLVPFRLLLLLPSLLVLAGTVLGLVALVSAIRRGGGWTPLAILGVIALSIVIALVTVAMFVPPTMYTFESG